MMGLTRLLRKLSRILLNRVMGTIVKLKVMEQSLRQEKRVEKFNVESAQNETKLFRTFIIGLSSSSHQPSNLLRSFFDELKTTVENMLDRIENFLISLDGRVQKINGAIFKIGRDVGAGMRTVHKDMSTFFEKGHFEYGNKVHMDFPSALRLAEYFSSLGDAHRPPHLRHTLFLSSSLHDCGYHVPQNASDFKATEASSTKRSFHATSSCNLAKRDLYEILGVHKDASANDIKNAFLALAKKYHPDTNKNNPAVKREFQEIRDAYEVFSNLQTLRDSAKRAKYDEESRDATRREYATEETVVFTDAPEEQFSDSFRKIFSEIFESEAEEIAGDVQVDLLLSFGEAAKGCKKHLSFDAHVTVPPFTSTCTICKGVGRIIKESCMACKGSGVVQGVKEVTVAIPAG
ncbi:hypothetical protein Scep_023493 [Stephania cephalantha]|uniref:J domain-containing protein n=1 Tax=Stephania cephalantha TaxID=152367 RepID=A0AAP0HSU4_9MAGN